MNLVFASSCSPKEWGDHRIYEQYLTNWLNYCSEAERTQDETPLAIVLKLRELKAASLVGANG
jgi:hypothetical protein